MTVYSGLISLRDRRPTAQLLNGGVIMKPELKEVAEKLRGYREASALSQKQIADALGIERSTYTKYETGETPLKLSALVKIAEIFNIPAEALLPENSEKREPSQAVKDMTADSPIFQLSKDERGLIARYRALSKEEKRKAVDIISEMSKKDDEKGTK